MENLQRENFNLIIISEHKPKKLVDRIGLKLGLINLQERMDLNYNKKASLEYSVYQDGYLD